MKILVADDSRAMRMIVARTLRQAGLGGHTIVEAENGRDALALAEKNKPDLILSDWNMPEMNGMEFLLALRVRGISTPFWFVTSEVSEEIREQAQAGGAMGLITKPFTSDMFEEALSSVVSA